jgi:hypothetical protein
VGVTAFGGCVPSDLWRFLPLAVFFTCLAEMVLLPTRFFFASAMSILLSEEVEDTGDADLDGTLTQADLRSRAFVLRGDRIGACERRT